MDGKDDPDRKMTDIWWHLNSLLIPMKVLLGSTGNSNCNGIEFRAANTNIHNSHRYNGND